MERSKDAKIILLEKNRKKIASATLNGELVQELLF